MIGFRYWWNSKLRHLSYRVNAPKAKITCIQATDVTMRKTSEASSGEADMMRAECQLSAAKKATGHIVFANDDQNTDGRNELVLLWLIIAAGVMPDLLLLLERIFTTVQTAAIPSNSWPVPEAIFSYSAIILVSLQIGSILAGIIIMYRVFSQPPPSNQENTNHE